MEQDEGGSESIIAHALELYPIGTAIVEILSEVFQLDDDGERAGPHGAALLSALTDDAFGEVEQAIAEMNRVARIDPVWNDSPAPEDQNTPYFGEDDIVLRLVRAERSRRNAVMPRPT